jgi:glycosyltransferase involved in cell wall biosynthesis
MADSRPHVAMLVRNPYTHDTRVEKEARTLVGAGYRVTVVADGGPGLPERETRDGSTVLRVPRSRLRLPGLRFVAHELTLARRLRALRPTILHAHDSNALVPVALAAWVNRTPYVYDAHELWLERPRRERTHLYFALSNLYYRIVERLLVPRAAATITVTGPIVEHLAARYGLPRVALVPNYPDYTEPPPPIRIHDLPGAERLDAGRPVVLYLGGLMADRGLPELLDAMALVPDAQLVLLGGGVLGDALRAQAERIGIADRSHLLPPVPPDDVIAAAASADVGVSPTIPSSLNNRWSLPNKLFQYMAAGVPVVASDFPQVREVVDGARCGVVVDTTDPARIADGIRRILADRDEARAMGERGRAAVADRFNWDVSARSLSEVYANLSKPEA